MCIPPGTPLVLVMLVAVAAGQTYVVVDTGQTLCYDDVDVIPAPPSGARFHGQDAQHAGPTFAYQDNGDGTVTDLHTGLMWQQTPELYSKSTFAQAVAGASSCLLAGHTDWRLPTVKELYSLMDFRGSSMTFTPYIDTGFFVFRWGDPLLGERTIDTQYWSCTEYVGRVFGGDLAAFGVNFGDGRIKGYPTQSGPGGQPFTAFVRYVRGNPAYGINDLVDNGDGTVTDRATGLMWMQGDAGSAMIWEAALAYAENLHLAGHDDWRLPSVKELQSIVDYTRAPDAVSPAPQGPAIDPIFSVSEVESFYWSSTTLLEAPPLTGPGAWGAYVAFGQAFGYMAPPGGTPTYMNVHGAGAQRSDPKSGDPATWAGGFGPQGDEIRILNHVRAVRTIVQPSGCGDCNLDGLVNIIDALQAAQHAVGLVTLQGSAFDNCDPDASLAVDIVDALQIAQHAAGMLALLSCP